MYMDIYICIFISIYVDIEVISLYHVICHKGDVFDGFSEEEIAAEERRRESFLREARDMRVELRSSPRPHMNFKGSKRAQRSNDIIQNII